MRVFIAGLYTANFSKGTKQYENLADQERAGHDSVENKLESYHYIHKDSYVDKIRTNGDKVFLDSGAFSAFTLGKETDIYEYIHYIKRHEDIIEMASVLDGIGDPLKTYHNQGIMERAGTKPLPCFHYNEDERYLEHYIKNYEYITIGGMVPVSTPQLFHWLDRIWGKYLCDGAGRPRIKVHGFGLTSTPLMQRYPWYSVDSSSWVQIGAHGNLFMPGFGTIAFSSLSPNRKVENQHIDTLPPIMRARVEECLRRQGYDETRMRENTYARWAYNAWAYAELGRSMESKELKFINGQEELF